MHHYRFSTRYFAFPPHSVAMHCSTGAKSVPRCNVYTTCMSKVRTNIEIEDDYLQAVIKRYRLRSKTEAVDLALRYLAGQPMTRDEAVAMAGAHAIDHIPRDTGPEH